MSVFDSDLKAAEIDVKGLRSSFVRTDKIFDSRDIKPSSSRRVREDLRQYILYIADNLDSDDVGASEFDSDNYGIPAGWSTSNDIYNGLQNSANWTKLRNRLKQSQRSFDDGSGNIYTGAPHVVLAADSDDEIVYHSIFTLFKAHFADWLASDKAERHKINTTLNNLTANDTLLGQLTDKLVGAFDSDRSAHHDLFNELFLKMDSKYPGVGNATHRSAATVNDAITSPFYKFNQYALLVDDSDVDAEGRGRLWRLRQKMAEIVLNGIQFDSEFGGGDNLNFGRNKLLSRLNAIQNEFVRRASFSHLADITTRFYNFFDYQWIRRDSDGSGNLTDSDSKGYSLDFKNHVVPGFQTDDIDDSEQILNYIKRINGFANFFAKRLGATDSDKLENVYDSDYASMRTNAEVSRRSNYYHYHPSFLARFKQINTDFVQKVVIDGYMNRADSDETATNTAYFWERFYQYLNRDDSAAAAFYTRLLNVANEDSDLGALQGDTTITTVAGLDSEDLRDADELQLFIARQTVNIIDSDSELQASLARNIKETFQADSDLFQDLLSDHTEFIHEDWLAYFNADSDRQKEVTQRVVDTIETDSDQRVKLSKALRPDVVTVQQEHIVGGSESSYSSFTFYVPRQGGRLIYNLPTNKGPVSGGNIKVFLNGLLLSSATSYNKAGDALVSSGQDISSVLVSTSESDPYITVNFAANVDQTDIIQIQYTTTIYR